MSPGKAAAVKVTFGNETRRVGRDYFQQDDEWVAFCQRLRTLLQRDLVGIEEGAAFDVTYKDDDNDVVTIRSTAELREAFNAQGELARFTVSENAQPQRGFGGGCRRGGWWRRHHGGAGAWGGPWGQHPRHPHHQHAEREQGENSAQAHPQPHPRCLWGVSRIAITAAQMNAEAVELMGQNKLEEAAALLKRAVERYATYSPLWYNLACVESLRGERPGALAALRAAVQNGYRDADHAIADEDLICLQSNPEFEEIVQCMRNGDQTRYLDNPTAYLNSSLLSFRKEGAIGDAWKVVETGVQSGVKEPLFLYNAACIASLLDRKEEACEFLLNSVLAGYTDKKLIETDEDLSNVRAHPGYLSALNLLSQTTEDEEEDAKDVATSSPAPVEAQDRTEAAVSPSASVTLEQETTEVAPGSVHEWVEIEDQTEADAESQEEEEAPVVEEASPREAEPASPAAPQLPVASNVPAHRQLAALAQATSGLDFWNALSAIVPQYTVAPQPTPAPVPAPVPIAQPTPQPVPVAAPVVVPTLAIPSAPPAPVSEMAAPLETPRTASLVEMGFDREAARAAIVANNGDMNNAVASLLQ